MKVNDFDLNWSIILILLLAKSKKSTKRGTSKIKVKKVNEKSNRKVPLKDVKLNSKHASEVLKKEKREKRKKTRKTSKTRKTKKKPKKLRITRKQKGIKQPETSGEVPEQLKWIQEDPHELLLSRFIETPKGTRLGESIGIDGSSLIMKNKNKFYSISLKAIKEKGDILILRRKVNWKTAEKLGEKWRKKTLDVIEVKKSKYSKVIKID